MKKILLILISVFTVLNVFSQIYVQSPTQQMVEDAVSNGIYVIEQSYQIRENATGRMYGSDGKNVFGTTFSLGFKATKGFYVYDKAARPWEYDSNYKQLEKDRYTPVISSTTAYKIGKSNNYDVVKTDTVISLNDENVWRLDVEKTDSTGFSILKTRGTLMGWVVLATIEKGADLADNPDVNNSIYRRELVINDEDKTISFDAAHELREVVGGIFVVPENTGIGQITFRLAGLIKQEDEKWQIALIHETNLTPTEPTPVLIPVEDDVKIVPETDDSENQPEKKKTRKNKRKQ